MDDICSVFWESFRYLFPPHALAMQTPTGNLMVSWSTAGDPDAHYAHATPIAIRFEQDLVEVMRLASLEQRRKIAKRQEGTVKAGMVGYDPYASVPKSRVIVLG